MTGQGEMVSNQRFGLDIRKKIYGKGVEALAQDTQRDGECPIPGDIHSQAGWGAERCRCPWSLQRFGLDGLYRCLPTQMIP